MQSTRIYTAIPLILGVLVTGCAPHVKLSEGQRPNVLATTVAPVVTIPERPMVLAKDAATSGFILGPIGYAVAAMTSEEPTQLKNFLESSRIDVRQIVRDEFIRQSALAKTFPTIVDQGGDATVHLAIESYGLAWRSSFSPFDKPVSPQLRVVARMSTASGGVLWQKDEFVTASNSRVDAHKFDEYLASRELTEKAFKKAAEVVVEALLEEFNARPEVTQSAGASPARTEVTQSAGALPARSPSPLFGPDKERFQRGHDTGGNIRFESEAGADGRCSSWLACGSRDPMTVEQRK